MSETTRAAEDHQQEFWSAVDAGYATLRADPAVWEAEQADRIAWEQTLPDGLDPAERWNGDGSPRPSNDTVR